MRKTVKRSMYFPEPQMVFLREEADHLGLTVSALIVRIIDRYREERQA